MRTRAVATVTASLLAVFLMGLGPPAGAGVGPTFLANVQMTSPLDEGDTGHLTGNLDSQCQTSGGVDLAIDWGDGSEVQNVNEPAIGPFDVEHAYADDDPSGTEADLHTVQVTATDACGNVNNGGPRTNVRNVAPSFGTFTTVPHIAGEASRIEVEFTDPGTADTFTVTINWGDGSQNTVLLLPHIQKIREGHRYIAPDQYKVGVTVEDDDLGTVEDSIFMDVPLGLPRFIIGPDKGRPGLVKTYDEQGSSVGPNFLAYRSSYTGGVRVAAGDVNGDGFADIVTAAGGGGSPLVRVWQGPEYDAVRGFFAYRSSFNGGVFVAAGDVDGDGYAEIITGAGAGGGPLVKVFDGRTRRLLDSFFAFNSSFNGGVRVAVGDVNGDGVPDIITGAGKGGSPHVKAFDGVTGNLLQSFFAYNPSFQGGVFVAAGDVNGDGIADIITGADAGGSPLVKAFSVADPAVGVMPLQSFFAYNPSFTGGVRVAAGDLNGDGVAEIITGAGAGAGPHVKVFDGKSVGTLMSFFAYNPSFTGGVFVAFGATMEDHGT